MPPPKRPVNFSVIRISHLYEIDMVCLRFFTVYGPRQRPDLAIHKFARLIEAGKPIPVFGDGSMMRDHTYIDDIIDGIVGAMNACKGYEIYNLGESRPIRLDDAYTMRSKRHLAKKRYQTVCRFSRAMSR